MLEFFTFLFSKGRSYSVLKAARSSLANFIFIPPYRNLSDHPLVQKYFKGAFNLRPPNVKFGFVWDVQIVFDHFRKIEDNSLLNDKQLSQKLVLLLLLLGGQRVNTVMSFHVHRMVITNMSITFTPNNVLKHSRQSRKRDVFEYYDYSDKKLCIIDCLNQYLSRRSNRVSSEETQLLITLKKPFHAASDYTVRRWIKDL